MRRAAATFASILVLVPADLVAQSERSAYFAEFRITEACARQISDLQRLYREIRPPLRGFRATIPGLSADDWVFEQALDQPEETRALTRLVAKRLALDGLLGTTIAVIEVRGADRLPLADADLVGLLREIGLPTDLLGYFDLGGGVVLSPPAVVREIAKRLLETRDARKVAESLAKARFRFRQSRPGFRAASDTGEDDIGMMRLQFSTERYHLGPGDGSTLDIAHQLVQACPNTSFLIAVPVDHSHRVKQIVQSWFIPESSSRCTFTPVPHSLSQWAQDNGKPGKVDGRIATIVPRYASRGEEGSTFVPGDSLVMAAIVQTGHSVIHSPLIFQGGNLIVAKHPARDDLTLLIGEGEIYRNTALGLTKEQVIEAFRIEFGAAGCVVLPSVSYHIDYEVSIRNHSGQWLAFVNDADSAVRHILRAGVDALVRVNVMGAEDAKVISDALAAGQIGIARAVLRGYLARNAGANGQFPESLAKHFSTTSTDSGIGNFQKFLLAVDLIESEPDGGGFENDPATTAYRQALDLRDSDRSQLKSVLAQLGCIITPIPSLAEENRSLNYINGIHYRGGYLMPAQGGLFSGLDDAARAAFAIALGPNIKITAINSAESQRRAGAVRCSASAYPRP